MGFALIIAFVFIGGFWIGVLYGSRLRPSSIRPKHLVDWYQRQLRLAWHRKSHARKGPGRPPTPGYVENWIVTLHRENRGYSARRIAAILRQDLQHPIDKNTVARVLKKHGLTPNPEDGAKRRSNDPNWRTFLHNHAVCSMDFKTTRDAFCRQVFILNIIDHHRRRLILSRATHHPTSGWVAQQIREAFPFDDALGRTMLLDRDSIFAPVAARTLPAFGMRVRRTAYRCPWQNAMVERFHRTLQEELLSEIVTVNLRQLNRLLSEYQLFYNTARPHMANNGDPPTPPTSMAANDADITLDPSRCRLQSIEWLGGLHHSYRLSA